jgi:putative endonuclease
MERRMLYHNELAEKGYTKRFRPWVVIYTEEFETKAEAMKREKWFKSGIGRAYIKANILKGE